MSAVSGGIVGIPSRKTLIYAAVGVCIHVEISGEIASGWTGKSAGLIREILELRLAILPAFSGRKIREVIRRAKIHTHLQEGICVAICAARNADIRL